jgi:hypothetical protein
VIHASTSPELLRSSEAPVDIIPAKPLGGAAGGGAGGAVGVTVQLPVDACRFAFADRLPRRLTASTCTT